METVVLFLFILYQQTISQTLDSRIEGIDKDKCEDYPWVTINLCSYLPDIGFVVYFNDLMFVLEKPKTTLHYPRLIKVNTVRITEEDYYPFNAIVRVGEFMKTNAKYYALKFNRNDPVKMLRHYEMQYLSADPSEVEERDLKNMFLNIENLPRVRAVIAALVIPTSGNDYYSGVIYNVSQDNQDVTEVKFKVNGNVQVAKNSIETVDSVTNDNRMVTLDIFDFIEHQTAIGYRSYGLSFRYFMGDDAMPSIVGKSAWFDNQILIGCPINYCYGGEIDAGTIAADNKMYLFFNSYYYALPSDKRVFPASNLAKFISEIPVVGLGPGIRYPIYAAFSHNQKTYLFASDNRVWVSRKGFTDFMEFHRNEVFRHFPIELGESNIDAAFTNINTDILFILKDSIYYVLNLDNLQTDDRYVNTFPLGERSYPRPMRDFEIIPEQVDAAITMPNGETYLTYAEFVFVIKNWDQTNGRALERPDIGLIQDLLFDCSKYDYSKTEYSTKKYHDQFVHSETPEASNATQSMSIKSIGQVCTFVFGSMIALVLAMIAVACLYETKNQKDRAKEYKQKNITKKRIKKLGRNK